MNDLKISLVQTALHWENAEANLEMLTKKIAHLQGKTDLIILPEMFTTGFSMNVEKLAENMDGNALQWMKNQTKKLDSVITGSLIIKEGKSFYNRLIWMRPDGTYDQCDKRHLFTLAKEHHSFTAGTEKLIVELKGWKICPLVCYDLRFPVWSRNVEEYDILIYTANFPAKRKYAWQQLLKARAIENQCYVLAVNIVGEDGNGFAYAGNSAVINPMGRVEEEIENVEGIINQSISKEEVDKVRRKLPFLNDRDDFNIR
jgi:omega-amidase